MADFRRPSHLTPQQVDAQYGGDDPAETSRIAHETAQLVLARARTDAEGQSELVDRLVAYTDENGIDTIAELWSQSAAVSLPGALWRIYLLRLLIRRDPDQLSYVYRRGVEASHTIDSIVAGASTPAGPDAIVALADQILRGLFDGDFAVALDRAAAFCRVLSAGCTSLADDMEATEPHHSSELTQTALRHSQLATELTACARAWVDGTLE